MNEQIEKTIRAFYPDTQAAYLFGTYGTEYERTESDIDIGLLLPPATARQERTLALSECRFTLERNLEKTVDLINLRKADTVLCMEIITTGRVLFTGNRRALDEFEALTLSLYQKLNSERREILDAFDTTGKACPV